MKSITLGLSFKNPTLDHKLSRDEITEQTAKRVEMSIDEDMFVKLVTLGGFSFGGFLLGAEDESGAGRAWSDRYRACTLIAFDFDKAEHSFEHHLQNAIEAGYEPWFCYDTISSTPSQRRWRMVYKLDYVFHSKDEIKAKLKQIDKEVFSGESDKATLSALRWWQGTTSGVTYQSESEGDRI